jgi:hypothetical protein
VSIANHDVTSANHDVTIANHDVTIANHDVTIANHDVTIANHDVTIANHDATIANHDATIANHDEISANHDEIIASHDAIFEGKWSNLASQTRKRADFCRKHAFLTSGIRLLIFVSAFCFQNFSFSHPRLISGQQLRKRTCKNGMWMMQII